MLLVVDPNVLISSRVSDLGHPARIARAADEGRFELILSERLLGELSEVLMRPRFRRYATEEEVEDFLLGLREKGIFFEDVEAERLVPDDPKDDHLVALTRVSGADYLVSGDPHLPERRTKYPSPFSPLASLVNCWKAKVRRKPYGPPHRASAGAHHRCRDGVDRGTGNCGVVKSADSA